MKLSFTLIPDTPYFFNWSTSPGWTCNRDFLPDHIHFPSMLWGVSRCFVGKRSGSIRDIQFPPEGDYVLHMEHLLLILS